VAEKIVGLVPLSGEAKRRAHTPVITEAFPIRLMFILATVVGLGILVFLPLLLVFVEALRKGVAGYLAALANEETWHAIKLSLLTTLIVVPANTVFGISAAWLLAKHRFWGRRVLSTVIDLPFSVSPVVSGLVFVLLFGAQGILGPWLASHDIKIIFALPGIVIATAFVTFPFVAREVLPALEASGNDEEEAALTLGAHGWTVFFRVTLPKIKWAVLYGVVLCTARSLGEFGAVSVVSGHIRGETNTMPLQVEILYNEYDFTGAFSVASLLTLVAVVTLTTKKILEWNQERLRNDSYTDR
jgi:sulfate/thiosulfate transport system permease protein